MSGATAAARGIQIQCLYSNLFVVRCYRARHARGAAPRAAGPHLAGKPAPFPDGPTDPGARPVQGSPPGRRGEQQQRDERGVGQPGKARPCQPRASEAGWPVLCHSKLRRVPPIHSALHPARGSPQPTAPLASPAMRPHTSPAPASVGRRSIASHRAHCKPYHFHPYCPNPIHARAAPRGPGCRAPRNACVLTSNKIRHQNARAPPGSRAAARGPHARRPGGGSKNGVRERLFEVRRAPSRDKTPNRVWVWGLRRAVA